MTFGVGGQTPVTDPGPTPANDQVVQERPPRIILDAAYGLGVGYGHISRLATVGQELKDRGAEVFWHVDTDDIVVEPPAHPGVQFLGVPGVNAWRAERAEFDALIIDGRETVSTFESKFSFSYAIAGGTNDIPAYRLNNATRVYLQAPTTNGTSFQSRRLRGGARWMVVRDAGDGYRSGGVVVVSFGASEQGRLMAMDVLGVLADMGKFVIVMWPETWGPAPRWNSSKIMYWDKSPRLPLIVREKADVFVGSLGITTWEVLRACVPGIYYGWTPEHIQGYAPLVDRRTVTCLGLAKDYNPADLKDAIERVESTVVGNPRPFVDAHLRLGLDGLGAQRIANEILDDIAGRASIWDEVRRDY